MLTPTAEGGEGAGEGPQDPWRDGRKEGWRGQARPLSPGPSPAAVDGGITVEKELSKDELLAVLKLSREARGAAADIPRLLKVLSQMERNEVRPGPCLGRKPGREESIVAEWSPTPTSSPQGLETLGIVAKAIGAGQACAGGGCPGLAQEACSLCSSAAKHHGVPGTEIQDQE